MAKKRKPQNESELQAHERHIKEAIANSFSRSEKTSWNRKMDNMVKLIARLRSIEDDILDIIKERKQPVMDEVHQLRQTMVKECIHPFEYLEVKDDHAECKFCGKRLSIPNVEE